MLARLYQARDRLRRSIHDERGFSLTEVLVVASLGIVVIGLPLTFVVQTFIDQNNATSRSATTNRVEVGVLKLVHDLRQATAVTLAVSGSTYTATLKTPPRDATGGTATPAAQLVDVTWACAAGGSCTRRVGTGTAIAEIPYVISASFSGISTSGAASTSNPSYVTVTVTARISSEQGPHANAPLNVGNPITVTDGVALRNFAL
jgi:hypothetical protein